ncbi:MAG TPA: ATP-binding cassette domain-containing protein [Symbiobacteriaceae bacterium]|jgi:ABC-type multidrug transport system ATPase subunit
MDTLLTVTNLEKAYGKHQVLKGLTLSVNQGEVLALLGPNGVGKSTLLRVMSGFARCDGGQIVYRDTNVTNSPHLLRQAIGFLADRPFVYSYLTASEFLSFIAKVRSVPIQEAGSICEDLAIPQDVVIADMSYGTMRKVAIAAALIGQPSLVLMDEPFNALDYLANLTLQEIIRELRDRGCSIVVATHYLPGVEQIYDRAVILNPELPPEVLSREEMNGESLESRLRKLLSRGERTC